MGSKAKRAVWLLPMVLVAAFILDAAPNRSLEIATAQARPIANSGQKGLQVHPNEFPAQVQKIATASTNWVRLEFEMEPDGSLHLTKYDGVVDSIGLSGMAVMWNAVPFKDRERNTALLS
jgi:hypothetical protein